MDSIIETRNLNISWKVVSAEDIRRLFFEIETELNRLKESTDKSIRSEIESNKSIRSKEELEREIKYKTQYRYNKITIVGIDGSIYESESFNILDNGGLLDTKQIEEVNLYASDQNHGLHIYLKLKHTNSDYQSYVSVKGGDSLWINGLMRKIEDNINTWKKQNILAKKYFWLTSTLSILAIGFILLKIVMFIISMTLNSDINNNTIPETSELKNTGYFALLPIYIIFCGISVFPGMTFADKIRDLWRNVELQTGLEHNQLEKQRRRKLWLLITIIILPLIFSLFF